MCRASGIFFPCIYVCAWRECSACVGQKKELPCSWQASNPGPLNCWVISSPCSLISNFYFVPGVINLLLFLQLGNVLCAMTSLASSHTAPLCTEELGQPPPHLSDLWHSVSECGSASMYQDPMTLLVSAYSLSAPSLIPWILPTTSPLPSLTLGSLLLFRQQYPSQAICLVLLLRSSFSQIPTWAFLFCFFWS